MSSRLPTNLYTLCIILLGLSQAACAQDQQVLIDQARSAAPSMVSKDATIMYRGKVLVEGSNGWTCMPEALPDDMAAMCNDATWMEMMGAVGNKAPYIATKIGVSYMLQGDGGVSNSDPYHPDPKSAKDFIQEGPHLMLILPKEMLSGITDDPHKGGPYVMWKDTPYAHIMIPIGDRK